MMKLKTVPDPIKIPISEPLHNASCDISNLYKDVLCPTNPKLIELKEIYSNLSKNWVEHSQWSGTYIDEQLTWPYIRGDNAYVWQARDGNELGSYQVAYDYLKMNDSLNLFEKITEDGAFGILTYQIADGAIVSRDMLDSINEINFLENVLGISTHKNLNVLDIGAGYGRLAHRMVQSLDNLNTFHCADAIPTSTFIQNFYASYRCLNKKVVVHELHQIDVIIRQNISIAVNIHSFSECTIASIEYWVKLLKESSIKYLMIAPNSYKNNGGKILLSKEVNRDLVPYEYILNNYGYHLIVKQPKYLNPTAQKNGLSPTYYYLFELIN